MTELVSQKQCTFPNCGKLFSNGFSLKRHQYLHSNNKPYSCPYCNKSFSLLQYLQEHKNSHTREEPYICGVDGCQEAFR